MKVARVFATIIAPIRTFSVTHSCARRSICHRRVIAHAASDAAPLNSSSLASHLLAIREAKQKVPSPDRVAALADWCRISMDKSVAFGQIIQLKANFVKVRLSSVEHLTDLEGNPTDQWPHNELLCNVRGILKKMERRVFVGDRVRVTGIDWVDGRGCVDDVEDRSSLIEEPAVANVDQLCVVFSASRPDFSFEQASRFLVTAEATALPVSVVVNKSDLVTPEALGKIRSTLQSWGYDPVCVSAKGRIGLEELKALLHDKTTVLAGPSGVGKSSLINAVRIVTASALQGVSIPLVIPPRSPRGEDQRGDEADDGELQRVMSAAETSTSGRTDRVTDADSEPDLDDLSQVDLEELLDGLTEEEAEEALGMPLAEFRKKFAAAAPGARVDLSQHLEWFELAQNALGIELARTGSVGKLTGLGTHTTRHVCLLELPGGGYLADTPGFNKPTLDQVSTDNLDACMPEIARLHDQHGSCRFPGCTHLQEPGCTVRSNPWDRYESYKEIRAEVQEREDLSKRRSSSKKGRQGKTKVMASKVKGGEDRVEARLDSKKFRRKDRRLVNQELGVGQGIIQSDDFDD